MNQVNRKLEELRNAMRDELRGEALTCMLSFSPSSPTAEPYAPAGLQYKARALVQMRPYRLCIDQANAAGWIVARCKFGMHEALYGCGELPATAFPPLPEWMLDREPPANVAQAIAEAPAANVVASWMYPGMDAELVMRPVDYERRPFPRAWLLADTIEV